MNGKFWLSPFFTFALLACGVTKDSSDDATVASPESDDSQGITEATAQATVSEVAEATAEEQLFADDTDYSENYRQTALDRVYVSCLQREAIFPPWSTIDQMIEGLKQNPKIRDIEIRRLEGDDWAMDVTAGDSLTGKSTQVSIELKPTEAQCDNPNGDTYQITGVAANGERGSKNQALILLGNAYESRPK